jgi:hypothetical protein
MNNTHPQYERDSCYFCHEQDTHILETHHVVPRRFGGTDSPENLVRVCPNCHSRLERLYDGRFYDELGVEAEDQTEEQESTKVNVMYIDDEARADLLQLVDFIATLPQCSEGAQTALIVDVATTNYDISENEVRHIIGELKQKGKVYEQRHDRLRATGSYDEHHHKFESLTLPEELEQ